MSRTRTTRAVHIAPAGDSSSGFVVVDCFSLIIGSPSSSVPAAAAMVCFWIDRPFLPWVFVGIYNKIRVVSVGIYGDSGGRSVKIRGAVGGNAERVAC